MQIVYPKTYKRYNIRDLAVVWHDIPNENNEMINTKCVEFIVIGKRHDWKLWAVYDEFKLANPHISLEE